MTLARIILPHESQSGWRLGSRFNSPLLFLTSKTDTVHAIDVAKHQGKAEDVRNRLRELDSRGARKARNREVDGTEKVSLGKYINPFQVLGTSTYQYYIMLQ